MRRPLTTSLLAVAGGVLLLAASAPALALPASSAATSGPMLCQGRTATIVGTGSGTVQGTDGPDVIVSNGSDVQAGNGDDLICMTRVRGHTYVAADDYDDTYTGAGNGDDTVVVVSADRDARLAVYLYAGDDTFVGGPEADILERVSTDDVTPSGGDDVIATHGGDDLVDIGTDPRSRAGLPGTDRVDLGSGDDTLRVYAAGLKQAVSLRGGRGHDTIATHVSARVSIDRPAGSIALGTEHFRGFAGFERFSVATFGHAVAFRGGPGADELRVGLARRVTARLGAGNDTLRANHQHVGTVVAHGGTGNDHLQGSHLDDRLFGGPGHDRVVGRHGHDTCRAEHVEQCER